tara:strand:+ start:155 stop:433 length:279 start_codon:yes stop_codon:yes gene_type:complete
MKINCSKGNFKIIQTKANQDELLVLGSWLDLVRCFGSTRVFLINQKESTFGIYVCKQECADFMSKLIQDMDSNNWEDFTMDFAIRNLQNLSA